ncbi:MAG: ribonuclease M5 [Myxococcales bacterium]|nr:ribonuclease M5 [Myxococcales bacterium]
MIREIIVVEGIHDASAVHRAVQAEVLCTGGFMISVDTVQRIKRAAAHAGIIVLTDPDTAGEQIRRRVSALAPGCKHAHLPLRDCLRDADIGVEHAGPEAIRLALSQARASHTTAPPRFTTADLHHYRLVGSSGAQLRRRAVGRRLGIGYANAKQLLRRLNHYGVLREELEEALMATPPRSQDLTPR